MRARASAIAVLALVVVSCAPDEEPTQGCSRLADCPFGKICDVPKKACVREPVDAFKGSFTCDVLGPDQESPGYPGAEIVGTVGGDRYALSVGAHCLVKHGMLAVRAFDWVDDLLFGVYVAEADAQKAGDIDVHASGGYAVIEAEGADVPLGIGDRGTLHLDGAAQVGKRLRGFVDVPMVAPPDAALVLGVPCPRGRAECGYDLASGAFCEQLLNGWMCTAACTKSCPAGAICSQGACATACATHDDCPAPLRCTFTEGQPRACF
jgi:hypothetical protein